MEETAVYTTKKSDKIIKIVFAVLFALTILIRLFMYISFSHIFSLPWAFVSIGAVVVILISERQRFIPVLLTFLAVAGSILFTLNPVFTLSFTGDKLWQYPVHRFYLANIIERDISFFPDKLPENVYSFSTERRAPVLQGDGFYSVLIETDESVTKDIASYAAEKAIECYSLPQQNEYDFFDIPDSQLNIAIPAELRTNSGGYTVYLMYEYHVDSYNHQQTRAIIINETENIVCWTEYSA